MYCAFPSKILDLFIIPLLGYLYFLKLCLKRSEKNISGNGLRHVLRISKLFGISLGTPFNY